MSISPSSGTCPSHLLLARVHLTFFWHVSISPSSGTCPSHLLLARVYLTFIWHVSISPSSGTCLSHLHLARVHLTFTWHVSISPSSGTCSSFSRTTADASLHDMRSKHYDLLVYQVNVLPPSFRRCGSFVKTCLLKLAILLIGLITKSTAKCHVFIVVVAGFLVF